MSSIDVKSVEKLKQKMATNITSFNFLDSHVDQLLDKEDFNNVMSARVNGSTQQYPYKNGLIAANGLRSPGDGVMRVQLPEKVNIGGQIHILEENSTTARNLVSYTQLKPTIRTKYMKTNNNYADQNINDSEITRKQPQVLVSPGRIRNAIPLRDSQFKSGKFGPPSRNA